MKERSINQIQPTGGIIRAVSLEMGSQQRKESQFSAQALIHYFQTMMDQQSCMMRVGQDVFSQSVTPVPLRICQFVEKSLALRHLDFVMEVALFFMAESFAIRDKKLEVSGVRRVHRRAVHFINDTVAYREPESAGRVVRGADTLLIGVGPERRNARSSEGLSLIHISKPDQVRQTDELAQLGIILNTEPCSKTNEFQRKGTKNANMQKRNSPCQIGKPKGVRCSGSQF